ncbi:MAG: hypothetical protein M0Z50_04060 [Planctomycetia bacterium]|nr:hypothetical protein [Planctomycetia bacterium]
MLALRIILSPENLLYAVTLYHVRLTFDYPLGLTQRQLRYRSKSATTSRRVNSAAIPNGYLIRIIAP